MNTVNTVQTWRQLSPENSVNWLGRTHEKLKGPFSDSDFERLFRDVPAEPQHGRLPARVAVWYEDTVEATFNRSAELLLEQYGVAGFLFWPGIQPDAQHLRLLGGNDRHPGQCLRWETIDLDPKARPQRRQKPVHVRDPALSPHAAIPQFVAQCPEYGHNMDAYDYPFLWAPGYECSLVCRPEWTGVPMLSRGGRFNTVNLGGLPCDYAGVETAVPVWLSTT